MKKKVLNLGLILGLALIVGFSFTSTTVVSAQAGTSSVPCADPPPGSETIPGASSIKRLCGTTGCPWKRVFDENMGTCTIKNTNPGLQ